MRHKKRHSRPGVLRVGGGGGQEQSSAQGPLTVRKLLRVAGAMVRG